MTVTEQETHVVPNMGICDLAREIGAIPIRNNTGIVYAIALPTGFGRPEVHELAYPGDTITRNDKFRLDGSTYVCWQIQMGDRRGPHRG